MQDPCGADVVAQYDRSFTGIPLRRHVELLSMDEVLGDVKGLSVLDLARGTGYYSKELRRRGAARVVGVDVSEEMIRATRAREAEERLGVEYVVADAGALDHPADGLEKHGAPFWSDLMRSPFELIVTCRKR